MRQFVIAMMGEIGSGKTHVARLLARCLGARIITTDSFRVRLRRQKKPMSQAPSLAERAAFDALKRGRPIIIDFDAANPERRVYLKQRVARLRIPLSFVEVVAPEKLILARLRLKRYTPRDLFQTSAEAIRVHHARRALRRTFAKIKPDFRIDNEKPLGPQIAKITQRLRRA